METFRPAFVDRPRPLLSYGVSFPEAVSRHVVDTFNAKRVYMICSGSLSKNTDALDRIAQTLQRVKVEIVGKRIGMKSHTLWSEVLEITADARDCEADLILTLGGGTLTDGAKVISFALANNAKTFEDLETLCMGPNQEPPSATNPHPSVVPIVSIPTTLSAGEYSNFAGATNDHTHRKHSFQAPLRGPQLIVLDPDLVASTTPESVWLSTGVRAVDHCVETLCAIKGTTEDSDELAFRALAHLVPGLVRCRYDPKGEDLDARLTCQLGSVDAMAACTSGRVQLGASHGIGHQLGPLGVGHGETSCILLPAVCKFNAKHNANNDRQARVRDFLLNQSIVSQVAESRGLKKESADLGDVLDALFRELGMPRSLSDFGIGRDKLDDLATNSLKDRWCVSNPVSLKEKEQVLEILEMVV
ncbi:iron-containing alcohol dehydrogenase [Aspergillus stella-maris]|uniref:iron-containing alcohol dehydrogenase n=1 Tax=Aspergillus stella-maris TaxID=1810926 RepID=UPI003CCE0386